MSAFEMTKHAIDRALDMALEGAEIRETVTRPRDSYWSDRTQSWHRTRGRLTACVVVAADGVETVRTFLWSKPSGWVADAELGEYGGRSMGSNGVRAVVKARRRARDQ